MIMGISVKETTPWFNGKTRVPAIPGVYERRPKYDPNLRVFSYWDGREWKAQGNTSICESIQACIDNASRQQMKSTWQDRDWRGLSKEPK
jgi:hypothetical protein